jgi:hypothetical protein
MVNVVAPLFCMVLLSFFQWVVPRADAVSRLGITLTLLLTVAAYKFTVTTMVSTISHLTILNPSECSPSLGATVVVWQVPPISYLTLLDKYVVLCSTMITMAAFEGGLLAIPDKESAVADRVDRGCLVVIAASFVLCHVYFVAEMRAAQPSRVNQSRTYQRLAEQRSSEQLDRSRSEKLAMSA